MVPFIFFRIFLSHPNFLTDDIDDIVNECYEFTHDKKVEDEYTTSDPHKYFRILNLKKIEAELCWNWNVDYRQILHILDTKQRTTASAFFDKEVNFLPWHRLPLGYLGLLAPR